MGKTYEIRDPIHGFIVLNEWERDIINHPIFQRLRRIRQLGMTDMVYPGAMHTRFEHSLGVMQVATRMFDHVRRRRLEFLKSELSFDEAGLDRDRVLIRLASLLHDIGHAPFSHVAESLMGTNPDTNRPYKHEDYSAAIVEFFMKDIIENHPLNQNYGITAENIAAFLRGDPNLGRCLLWRNLISSQLDADRADYLLRDSHHIGVAYGHYDLDRIVATLTVAIDPESDSPTLAIEEGGEHAAEGLIIARYMMFTQIYFHHTRRAYDYHVTQAIKTLLREIQEGVDVFPPPTSKENIEEYLKWDDWLVLGMISEGRGGDHGQILMKREHHRRIYETPEVPSQEDLDLFDEVREGLGDMVSFIDQASSSWYKFDSTDIPLLLRPGQRDERLTTLSERSSVVKGLKAVERHRIYVPPEQKENACKIVADKRKEKGGYRDELG